MNCRTFEKNLEDYLENGLDFAGRFGMERHAQQCIHCGKKMADAQHLSKLVQELDRVKAPPSFESSVLHEIGKRGLRRPFSGFRRFLIFGFDTPTWSRYALAASVLVILGLVFLYWFNPGVTDPSQDPAWSSNNPVNLDIEAPERSNGISAATRMVSPEDPSLRIESQFNRLGEGLFVNYHTSESDYGEYTVIGPDNHPMVIPLPDTIKVEISPPSEEYFLRKVSH